MKTGKKAGSLRKKAGAKVGKPGSKYGGARAKKRGGDPEGEGDPGPKPPKPPPPRPPEILAIVYRANICLPDNARAEVIDSLQTQLRAALNTNDLDVLSQCVSGNEFLRVRLFPRQGAPAPDPKFLRLQGAQFRGFVSAEFLQNRALAVWNMMPRQINEKGKHDLNGDIKLTTFSFKLVSPNRLVTAIKGVYDAGVANVNFEVTWTDKLRTVQGRLETDAKMETNLGPPLSSLLAAIFGPTGAALLGRSLIAACAGPPPSIPTLGSYVSTALPPEVMLPAGLKLVFQYEDVKVDSSGITFSGAAEVEPREPRLSITGPRKFAPEFGDLTVSDNYAVVTTDLRGKLTFDWNVQGGVASRPQQRWTPIRFDTSGMKTGVKRMAKVRAHVVDEDGLYADTSLSVTLKIAPEVNKKKGSD